MPTPAIPPLTLSLSLRWSRLAGTSCSPVTRPCSAAWPQREHGTKGRHADAAQPTVDLEPRVRLDEAAYAAGHACSAGAAPALARAHLLVGVAQDGGGGGQAQQGTDGR